MSLTAKVRALRGSWCCEKVGCKTNLSMKAPWSEALAISATDLSFSHSLTEAHLHVNDAIYILLLYPCGIH